MALGDVRRPAFPVAVELGHGVQRRGAGAERIAGSGQQFWPPRRCASPGVQQRDLVFTPIEGCVQRRQVGDLQRDRDQASHRGRVEDRSLKKSMRIGRAERPQCRPDRPERGTDAVGRWPDQQRVADVEGPQPDRQLAEQDDRCLARHDPVAPPVTGYGPDDQPENSVHGTSHQRRQPTPGFARHYDGCDHAYYRAEYEQQSSGRRDITYRPAWPTAPLAPGSAFAARRAVTETNPGVPP